MEEMPTRETVNQAVQQLFSMSVVAREEQGVHKDSTNHFEGYSYARRRREDSRYYRSRHVGLALNDIYGPNFDVDSFDTDSYHHPRYNGRPNFYRSQRYFDGYNRNTKDYRPRWLYPKTKARPWVRLNSDDRKRDNSDDRVKEVHKECIKSESVSKDTSVPNEEVQERPSSANSLGNNDVNIEGAITIKTEDISDTETECCFGEEYQFPEEINDITIECIDTNKSYLKPAEELTSMILENKRTPDVPSTACPCFDHVLQPSVRTSRPRRRHSVGGEQARKILHSRCKRSKSVGPAPSAGPLTRSKSVSRNLWGPLPLPSRMKRKQPENEGTEERASDKPEGKEERASDKPEGSGSAMMKYGEFKKLHTEKPDSHDLMQKLFGDSEDIEEQNIEQYKKLWNPQMFIQGRRKSKEGERKRKSTDERDEAQIKPKKVCKDEGSNKPNNEPLKVCHASNSTCMDIPFTPLAAISPFCPVKQKALITKYILRKATVILPVKGEAEVINVVQESEKTVTIDLTNEENADHVYDAICKELESLRSMPSFSLSDDKKEILVTSGSGLSTTIVRKKIGSSKGASMPDISSLDKEVSQKNLNAQEGKSSQLSDAQKPPTTSERNSSPELKKISSKHCRQIAANKLQSTEKKDLQISNKATNNNFNKKEVKPQKSEAKTAASGDVPDSDVAQSKKIPSITDSTVEITSRLETDHEHSLTMDAQNNSLNKNSNKKGVKPQKSKAKTPASGDVPDSDVAHPKKVPSITDSTVEITSRLEKDHEHSLTTDAQNNSVSLSSIKENLDPFLVFSNTATQQKSNVSTFNRESKIQEQPLQDSVKAMKNMEQDKNKSLTQTTVQLATAVLQQNGQDTCATVVKSNNPMSSSVTEQQKGLPADIPRINVPDQPIPESSSSLTVGMVLSQAVQDAITNAKQQKILLLDTQTMDVSGQPIPQTSSSVTAGMVPKQSGQDKASSSNIRNAEEQKNSPSDTQRTNMSGQCIPQTSSSVTVGIVSKQYGQDRASSSNVRNAEEQRNLLLDTQRMNISGQSIPQSSSSVTVGMVPKQSGQDRDSSSNIRNAEEQRISPLDTPRMNVSDQPDLQSSSSVTVEVVPKQSRQDRVSSNTTNAEQQKISTLDAQRINISGQPIPQTSSSLTVGMVPKQYGQDSASRNTTNAEQQKTSLLDAQRMNVSGQPIPQTSSSLTVGMVSKQYGQDRTSTNTTNAEQQKISTLDAQRMNISGQAIPQTSSSLTVGMVPKQYGQDRTSTNTTNAEQQKISMLDAQRMNISGQPIPQTSSSLTVGMVSKQYGQDRTSTNTTNAEQQKISTLDAQRMNISVQAIPQTSSSLTVGMVPKQYGQDRTSTNTTNAEQQKISMLDAQRMNISGQPIPQTSSSLTVGMVPKQYGQDRASSNATLSEQQKISPLDTQRMNVSGQPIPQTLTSVAVNIQRNSPNQVAGNRNSPITSNASTFSIPFSHGNFVPTSMAFGLSTNQSEQQKALPLDIERINASYYASKMSPNGRIEQHNNLQSEMIQVTTQPDVAFTPDKIAVRKPRVYKRGRSSKTLAMNMQKEQVANQPKVPQVINSMMMQLTSVADVQRSMAPNDNRTQVMYQNNPRIQVRQNLTDPVIENDTSTNNRQVNMIPSNFPSTNVQNLMISASKIPPPNVEIIKHLARSKDTIASQMLQHLSTVSSSAGVIPQMVNPSYAQSLSRYGVAQVPVPYQQQHHSDNACNCQRCCSHNNNRQLPPQHQTMPAALQTEPSAHQRVTSQHQTMLAAHQIPPSAHQRVPPHQTMTEAHQRVPQQHQTMPAALQTEPSVHQRVTPRHQTMPVAHQIQPSAHQRVLPQHQTMPEAHQRVFPQHQTIPEAHQRMPPQQQTMPEVHQRLPQQHQTMLEAHQRMPPQQQTMPEVHQRLPLQHQTMPEAHQRMPPQQQTMPEVHQRLPQQHQTMLEAHQRMPLQHQTMPEVHQRLPQQHQTMLEAHQRMPLQQQTMPEVHQRLPQQHQTMLEAHQRMPLQHQTMPEAHQRMPPQQQTMPEVHQRVPLQHQTMPLAHQTLPSSNQALNLRQVNNMQQPHHPSNAGLQKWQDHQKSYVNANSTWTPPLMQTSLAANQMDTNKQAVQSAQNQFVDTSQNLQYPAQSQANNVPITLETLLQEQNKVAPIPPSRQWISQQHQLEAQSLPNNQNTIDKLVGNRQELRPLYLEELLRETHYGIASIAVENNIRAVVFNGYKNHFPSEYVADQMGYYHRSFLFKLMNLADAASKSISDTFLADFNLRQYMSDLEITLKIKYKLVLTTQRLMVAAKTLFVAMCQTNRNNSWLVKVIDDMIKLEPWLDQQKPQTTEQEPNVSEEQQRINAAPPTTQSPASNRPPSQQSQHTAPPPTYEESQRVAPTQLPIIQLGPRPSSNFGVMVKPADSPHFENGYQVSSSPASTTSTGYASMGPDNSLTSPLCSPDIVRPQTAHDPEHQDVVVSYNQLDHMRLVDTDEDDDEKLEIKNHFSAEVTVDCVDLTGSPEVRVKDECVDLTENWFDEGRMKMWHEQVHAQIEPIEYEVEIKPEVMNNDVATTSAVEMYHAGFIGKMCTCGKPAVEICSCRKAMYCSEHCRILDWCNHKKQCQSDTIL